MSALELPGGFPFPLADLLPDPVMISRPCGCTSMDVGNGTRPMQVSWCVEHDPGLEPTARPGRPCRDCGNRAGSDACIRACGGAR